MLGFYTLFSGSSGNSAFIRYKDTRILIDCGMSARRVTQALQSIGENSNFINSILITHEHSDHVAGLRVFSKNNPSCVYATAPTWNAMGDMSVPVFNRQIVLPGKSFSVGDIDVFPFATSHDSAFSVGYVLNCGGISYAVATDNGKLTSDFAQSLRGCDTVLIEANYDQFMLENGAYPYYLKKRIASCTGHMSNEQAGKLACALARSGTKRIALGHLSKENNTPKTAYNTVLNMLKDEGLSVSLGVAARYDITDLLKIEPSDNELSPALPVL